MPDTTHTFAALDTEYAAPLALLTERGAGRLPHPGGDLLAHLRRTARRLVSWGATRELIAAGLCHAAYGTQGFPTALLTLAERDQLRSLIGDEAEAIVYAYCAWDRDAKSPHEIRDRFSGEYWAPPELLRRRLAELTVANEIDVVEHAALSADQHRAIQQLMIAMAPELSQAGWGSLLAAPGMRDIASRVAAPSGDGELAYRDLGSHGEHVVLWHGGAGPELTWSRQHGLSATHQLRIPWRRGCPPSAITGPHDWERDTHDLLRVMPRRAHVAAHSYGGASAFVAAASAPERFATLTLIEPPLSSYAAHDPDVRQLNAVIRAFIGGAPDARAGFLQLVGLPEDHPHAPRTERVALSCRDPSEIAPPLAALKAAGVPIAIVSGAHNRAVEVVCDAAASALGAQRWVLPGKGHAVARVPEFNARFAAFVAAAAAGGE